MKSSTRTTGTKYTVYPFSTLELRSVDLTGTGTAQDYALSTETTQIRLGAGSVSGRVLYNATMPRTGASNLHLFLEFGDHLGSTTFTIDHDTSEVVEYITYSAYGQTESDYRMSRWSNFRESFRFTGKEEDIEVGLNYHGARYYSPALKRWMSADPVTTHEAGSDINPYGYGGSNPTANVDPDGREFITIIAVVVISAVVAASTSATVQYATTGHIDWGWKGVAGAAFAGAIGGAVGMGVGALASGLGTLAAGSIGGAAGGASSGMAGTALAGGSASDIGKSAIIGAVSGAVGGAVGVAAGSSSSSGWTAFGGTMAGTGAGTAAGIGAGWALFGQDPTWQSAGIAFASAFGGALASTALSRVGEATTTSNTAGEAAGQAAGASANRSSDATSRHMFAIETAKLKAAIDSYNATHMVAEDGVEGGSGNGKALPYIPEGSGAEKVAVVAAEVLSGEALVRWAAKAAWFMRGTEAGQAVIGGLDDIARMALGDKGLSAMRQMIVNDKVWGSLSKAEQWAVNQKWLDAVIAAGEDVVVAGRNHGAGTAREIRYLVDAGYRTIRNTAGDIIKLVPRRQ